MSLPPPRSTLFPYTTLFRSIDRGDELVADDENGLAVAQLGEAGLAVLVVLADEERAFLIDRKSTRLNSSHTVISYAVFCLKKKNRISLSESGHLITM